MKPSKRSVIDALREAVFLPLFAMAIAGILLSVGYMLCPASMQGGEILTVFNRIGYVFVRLGGAVTDNAGLLFAVSLSAMDSEHSPYSFLYGAVFFLMGASLISPYTAAAVIPSIASLEEVSTALSVLPNVPFGIMAGLLVHQLIKESDSSFDPRMLLKLAGFAVLYAAGFGFLWVLLVQIVFRMGQMISWTGNLSPVLFTVFNRLLMPLNLHHALNQAILAGDGGVNDLARFWANETAKDPGRYMSGFFAPMMAGIAGGALVLLKGKQPGRFRSFVILSVFCSVLSGFSEPFEFLIAFTSPFLYLFHSLLYGLSAWLADLTGFRAGFALSGGIADLFFSAACPAASHTWLILPLCLLFFGLYYLLYRIVLGIPEVNGRFQRWFDDYNEEEK